MARYTPHLRALDWLVARPIAHRGLHASAKGIVENTKSAFAAAIKGNYAIECDLQLSKDGEAVVFHDAALERLTLAKGRVIERTAHELQRLVIKGGEDRMQTLGELLTQVKGQVPLVIELKSHWDGNVALAIRALQVLEPYPGPYALMSFDPDLVAAVAELSPSTIRGITADRTVDRYYNALPVSRRVGMRQLAHLEATRPHFISYAFGDLPFAPVQRFRSAGFPVISWTIRSKAEESCARNWSDQVTFEGYAA